MYYKKSLVLIRKFKSGSSQPVTLARHLTIVTMMAWCGIKCCDTSLRHFVNATRMTRASGFGIWTALRRCHIDCLICWRPQTSQSISWKVSSALRSCLRWAAWQHATMVVQATGKQNLANGLWAARLWCCQITTTPVAHTPAKSLTVC